MAAMLARNGHVLRDLAAQYLGLDAAETDVDAVYGRSVDWLLDLDHPAHAHAMRFAAQVVLREAEEEKLRKELARQPKDRRLGPLTGAMARAVERLGPRSRDTIWRVARGESPEQIAREENTTVEVVRVRLARARGRAWMLWEEEARSVSLFLGLAQARLRGLARSVRPGLLTAGERAPATTMLVPVVACSLLWPTSAPVPSRESPAPSQQVVLEARAAPASPEVAPVASSSTARPTVRTMPASAAQSQPLAVIVSAPRTAQEETPEDVTLTALATPADGRPVLVAIGQGHGCGCTVLMQSMDGGATWTATAGPPADAAQLVIPPSYPADGRIFAGVDPVTGRAPYAATSFGAPFTPIIGLPPGNLAVSSHFDDGDPRLFSAASTAVWSVDVASGSTAVPRDEVDYSGEAVASSSVAALATPGVGAGSPAVIVWAPAFAAVPGSSTPTPPLTSTLMRCPVSGSCSAAGALNDIPWMLATHDGNTIVAYTRSRAVWSHDGGATFSALPLPSGAKSVGSLALAEGGAVPWGSFTRPDGTFDVARLPAGSSWIDAAEDSTAARQSLGLLITVGTDRIIEGFSDQGYRCRLTSGGKWLPRCPTT